MTNIPTDLLRTLVAVVDLRSYTKAAQSLGVTQPAVSAQIKRLQFLLGTDLFDKSAPGIALTPRGEMVVNHARRLLSINDQIFSLAGPRSAERTIRVGTPGDFVAAALPGALANFREQCPGVRFHVRSGSYDPLIRQLRQGEIDLLVTLSMGPALDARHHWKEEMVWVRGATTKIDPNRPLPLVSYGEDSMSHRLAVAALKKIGRDWEDVFFGPSIVSLSAAVAAGLGVMVLARRRVFGPGLVIWDDGGMPQLPLLNCGIYIREGSDRELLEQLADAIVTDLRPDADPAVVDVVSPPIVSARAKTSAA